MKPDPRKSVFLMLARRTGRNLNSIDVNDRLLQDLGLDGDDAVELILELSNEFDIDMSGFNASDYFNSEPTLISVFRIPWRGKEKRDTLKSVSVGELVEAARTGLWIS